jgi:putative MATE family efflux protein
VAKQAVAELNPLLHAPVLPLLIRLALPTVLVLFMTTVLSVAETYFVSVLGVDAIAAASLVVPIALLMAMVSNGGIGGGVSSSIARARGAGRLVDAESLAWHALVIAVVAGAIFTLCAWAFGRALYSAMGGRGPALEQAVLYSNILFAGAISFWMVMLLQAALRGAGNVKAPAVIMLCSVALGLLISPALISGWLGLPHMGVAGAGAAQVICNSMALVAVIVYMRSARSSLRLRRHPLRAAHFRAILGIGMLSMVNAFMSTMSITAITAAAGAFGVVTIAGFGIGSRLEMLLVPIIFGFGTAAITVVGSSLGAGNAPRARRAALTNALVVGGMLEVLGLVVALFPGLWVSAFTQDPGLRQVAAHYLRVMGPLFGVVAVTGELYFAGQAAAHIKWPLFAGAVRFLCAIAAAVCVFRFDATIAQAFWLVGAGAATACLVSLFGFFRVRWPGEGRGA